MNKGATVPRGGRTNRGPGRGGSSPIPRELRLVPLRKVGELLDDAIATAVADETELVWLELRRNRTALRVPDSESYSRRHQTVQVRVCEHGRTSAFRTVATQVGEISDAIRQAMAQTTIAPSSRVPPLPGEEEPIPTAVDVYDRRVASLLEEEAQALLAQHARPDEAAVLEWSEGQVAVRNSRGLARAQRVTAISLQVRSGLGTGAGFATHAARSIRRLSPDSVFDRARRRRTVEPPTHLKQGRQPILLSSEATAELVEVLNHQAFAAQAFREGGSFLREHLGVQVFDRRLELRDDGTDVAGLPFPFDLEGRSKRPISLVQAGVPRTPTVDTRSAADFGVEPTGHCAGGEDAFALNLFLEPGEHEDAELLRLAEGGLWISRLERVACFDPVRVLVRAVARGVRKIEAGALTRPLPDLMWEDSVLRIFSDLRGVGTDTRCRLSSDGMLGGISAPPVVIGEASLLTTRRPSV